MRRGPASSPRPVDLYWQQELRRFGRYTFYYLRSHCFIPVRLKSLNALEEVTLASLAGHLSQLKGKLTFRGTRDGNSLRAEVVGSDEIPGYVRRVS